MTEFTDEERARIWAESYAALERREAEAEQPPTPKPLAAEPALEDMLTAWRREVNEQEARFARARARRECAREQEAAATAAPPVDWNTRIDAAVTAERQFILLVVGEAIAEIESRAQAKLDEVIRPVLAQVSELKVINADLRVENARLREALIERGGSAGAGLAGISSALN